jgi:hypothetical protein
MNNQEIKFEMTSEQGILHVYSDRLSITPKGVLAFLNKGGMGTKEIPYRSITAIQMKKAGFALNGFLQFTILGGSKSGGGLFSAVADENAFTFGGAENNALAHQIKMFIQREIDLLHEPKQQLSPSQSSVAEELSRLAELREKGVLSDEEFFSLKKRLIGHS